MSGGNVAGFAALLLQAGHLTTSLVPGNTVRCLCENSGVRAALCDDPSRGPRMQ